MHSDAQKIFALLKREQGTPKQIMERYEAVNGLLPYNIYQQVKRLLSQRR